MSIIPFHKKQDKGKGCQEDEGFPPPIFNRAQGGIVMPNVSRMGICMYRVCSHPQVGGLSFF